MSNINQLSSVTSSDLTTSDLLVVFSNQNGDSRKLSLGNLITYIRNNLTDVEFIITITTPANGFTETITQDGQDRWLLMQPTGSLATGTIVLPSTSVAVDGQEILVTTTQQISAFTVNGNGATAVNGAPSVLAVGDNFKLKYNALNTSWYKVA